MSEERIIRLIKELKSLITSKNTNDKSLDINQASNYTSISKSTLRRNVKSGQLKASTKLGKTLFKYSELENWLDG